MLWKETQESNQYDWKYVKYLTQILHESRTKEDIPYLMHTIRTTAMRNVANILNPGLYCKSYIGTKHLIENFQHEVLNVFVRINLLIEKKSL